MQKQGFRSKFGIAKITGIKLGFENTKKSENDKKYGDDKMNSEKERGERKQYGTRT